MVGWIGYMARALVLANGTLAPLRSAPVFLDFSAAVPSGPVYTGTPVELVATLKVTSPEAMDREALTLQSGFDPHIQWNAQHGAFGESTSRVVLGKTTHPPNGLVFVYRTTYLPPTRPGNYQVSVTPAADPSRAIFLTIPVEALSLELRPSLVTLAPGQEQTFLATFRGPSGAVLSWSATGGTVTPGGAYTAPAQPGTHLVSVRHFPSGQRASAQVTVTNSFGIQPASPELAVGQIQRFQVAGASGAVAWSVLEPEGGTIQPDGTYTAPKRPGIYHLEASLPPGRAQTTVVVAPLTLAIAPEATTLGMGQHLQLTAILSHGACHWSASAGEITEDGLFRAPLSPGTCEVTAVSTLDASVRATATLTIVAPGRLQVLPDAVRLHVGQTQQFLALGLPPDSVPAWLVQPPSAGEITPAGFFTAGPAPGPCSVMALVDDMVSTAAVDLIDTRLLPDPAQVKPGGTVQFTVQGLPDGSPVSWSLEPADAGHLSAGGVFTAGPLPAVGRVTASGGGLEVSASVQVLTSRIVPEDILLGPGETLRFAYEAYGPERAAPVWRLLGDQPGALMGPDGTYRAPTLQGIYRIAATDAANLVSTATVTVGPPMGLVVAPEVNILQDGVYTVRVQLRAVNGRTVEATFTGELHQGLAYPEVVFPAKAKLASLEADGPYTLARVTLSGTAGGETVAFDVREHLGTTEPFSLLESRRDWIRIDEALEARGQDPTAAGLFRTLAVSVPVELASDGEYRISGTLVAEDGTELDARSEVQAWLRGLHTAVLLFDGRRIHARGTSGPLSLSRFTIEGPVLRVRDFPGAIKGFDFRMFEP